MVLLISLEESCLCILLVLQNILDDFGLKVFLDVLNDFAVFVVGGHPDLQSVSSEAEVACSLVHSAAGDAVLDVWHVSKHHVDDNLLPEDLHDIIAIEDLNFYSEL